MPVASGATGAPLSQLTGPFPMFVDLSAWGLLVYANKRSGRGR
jgi:hypothetical protein